MQNEIQPAETSVGTQATLAGELQDEEGRGKANEIRRQGWSGRDKGGRESRGQERDAAEELLYILCCGSIRGRESVL
jgi:hypothetical protein